MKGQAQQEGGPGQAEVGAHHEDVAVGEVDHGEDAVDHGVAQGDEGVDAPQLQGVQDILGQDAGTWVLITVPEFSVKERVVTGTGKQDATSPRAGGVVPKI